MKTNNFYQIEPKQVVVAVDFDGTCVEADYPNIGAPLPFAAACLKAMHASGCKLILWTMRDGNELLYALGWFEDNHIPLYGIQRHPCQQEWTEDYGSPKCLATYYIDDRNIGIPVKADSKGERAVDWNSLLPMLIDLGLIK
jgi:hypothetical protein